MLERVNYGKPDLEIEGFQLWVHGRQFPESQDHYDGDWLRVTVHCGARGADVWAAGSLLTVTELDAFGKECEELLGGRIDTARLDPLEPALDVVIARSDLLGHFTPAVNITPDHLKQEHRFEFETDQTYIREVVAECQAIIKKYEIRGPDAVESNNA